MQDTVEVTVRWNASAHNYTVDAVDWQNTAYDPKFLERNVPAIRPQVPNCLYMHQHVQPRATRTVGPPLRP